MALTPKERDVRDKLGELIQQATTLDDAVEGIEGNVVIEWVVAASVSGIGDDGKVYTSYRRILPRGGMPPHHIDGLLDVVMGLDFTD